MKHLTGYLSAAAISLALGMALPATASAKTNQDVANKIKAYVQSNGLACMSCHSVSQKMVGPAWIDVSKKFHGNPKELSILTDRIHNGGSGTWGAVPMPPNMANQQQAAKLAKMISKLYEPN